ncbi:hypothetical protein E1B28_001777 [Marasmius oreades]|uniref:Uncharacterized protein n=1 Tax=Marasmius oreades TaxID=181124 RepID=A0A9P7V437_9AGAR|nr:uncharacterized protein E1B28_001777 [Marasmius oreades]KAG7099984.1 hypothetical protein E1B28_001777 [Marasmius oreades]
MQFYSILTINQSRSGIRDTLIAVVAKLNTAYTLLLLTETWATYEQESYSPSMLQLISYGVVFLLIVALFLLHPVKMIHSSSSQVVWSGPDTVLATALIYVLAALYHGPVFNPLWHNTFYWTAAVIAVVTAISIDFLIHNVHDNEEQGQRMDLEHNQKLKISVT